MALCYSIPHHCTVLGSLDWWWYGLGSHSRWVHMNISDWWVSSGQLQDGEETGLISCAKKAVQAAHKNVISLQTSGTMPYILEHHLLALDLVTIYLHICITWFSRWSTELQIRCSWLSSIRNLPLAWWMPSGLLWLKRVDVKTGEHWAKEEKWYFLLYIAPMK